MIAALAVAALVASLFAFAAPAGATQNVAESRVAGLDRYATAAAVAQATFPAPNGNIILASGENFPDGLAAAGLAGAANAPVLLTTEDALPSVTANAMAAIFGAAPTKTVHIVGGTAAVSQAVEDQVAALGYTINRIAGENRYETAADIAAFAVTLAPVGTTNVSGSALRTVIVTTGANFPDALAGGAPAFRGKHPILLTAPDALSPETAAALTSLSAQRVILLGGTAAVSQGVEDAIEASGILVTRVSGADRGETAKNLADVLVATLAAGGFNFYGATAPSACLGTGVAGPNLALIVSGSGFADALAAGPHGGVCAAPILIAGDDATSTFLTAQASSVGLIRAIGGTAAVSADALTAAVAAATTATPTAAITAFLSNDVIRVDFSETVTVGVGAAPANLVRVNNAPVNGECTAVATPPAVPLVDGTCYFVNNADGTTTLWTLASGDFIAGDTITVSGFSTPAAAGSRTIAPAQLVIPAAPAALSATITGAVAGATNFSVVYNRPVTPSAVAADVTLLRGATTTNLGPLQFADLLQTQLGTTLIPTVAIPGGALLTGDIITVTTTAATGDAGGTLANPATAVVPAAGAAASVTTVTGNVVSTGGVLLTDNLEIDKNVVIQSLAARDNAGPGSLTVTYVDGVGNNVATSAAAVSDAVTGITDIRVTLGTGAGGAVDATSAEVATAINTSASASALVTAAASNPASATVVDALATTAIPAGSRTLVFTATTNKNLSAVGVGNISYDANGNGFDDVAAPATNLVFTAPSNTFSARFDLGVGAAAVAAPTAGVSTLRLAAGATVDINAQPSAAQVVAFSAP
jgi:putative cell wall-binding protein